MSESKLYIQTREHYLDYAFLIECPELWWGKYKNQTSFEKPTIIIEKGGSNSRLYLSGIPSKRPGNQCHIQYTLVADLVKNNDKLAKALNYIILTWLEERKFFYNPYDPSRESKLGLTLDGYFSNEEVKQFLEAPQKEPEEKEKLAQKFQKKIEDIVDYFSDSSKTSKIEPVKPVEPESVEPEYWWGGLDNEESYQKWISLISNLLQGNIDGKALLLNLVNEDSKYIQNWQFVPKTKRSQTKSNQRSGKTSIGLLIPKSDKSPQIYPNAIRPKGNILLIFQFILKKVIRAGSRLVNGLWLEIPPAQRAI